MKQLEKNNHKNKYINLYKCINCGKYRNERKLTVCKECEEEMKKQTGFKEMVRSKLVKKPNKKRKY